MSHFTEDQQRSIGAAFGVAIGSLLEIGLTPKQIISVFRPEVAAHVINVLSEQKESQQ